MRSNSVLPCRQPELNHLRLKTIYSKKTIIRSDFRNSEVGDFNLPVGNVDFNSNVTKALDHYFDFCTRNEILFYTLDFRTYLKMWIITVVDRNKICINSQRLKQLIDNVFERRFDFLYDHSAPLRKQNS